MYSYPEQFPTDNFAIRNTLVVAPFWSDNDIRREGAVRYSTYDSLTDDNPNGKALLDVVNANIQAEQGEGEESFVGVWMLIAHWD